MISHGRVNFFCLSDVCYQKHSRQNDPITAYVPGTAESLPNSACIAESLFKYSWDGTSKAYSGNWEHSELSKPDKNIEQANYYEESSEHRCIQHGIALVFWSLLAECSSGSRKHDDICEQHSLILKQFVSEYWNGK